MDTFEGSKAAGSFFAKIENLSKIQRILIFASIFVLIIAIFIFVLYKPKLADIKKLNKELGALEKKLVVAKKNAADLEKFQKMMAAAEVEFKKAMKALPEKEEIPSLLTSISRSGQDVGLEFLLDIMIWQFFLTKSRACPESLTSKIFPWGGSKIASN
jgi:type IV pilus assembly protein PilO